MAPARKKRTAQPKPLISANLQEDEQHKLRVYISDFENQVERRLQAIERDGEHFIRAVDRAHVTELLKLPKRIRDMKWTDFVACEEGDLGKLMEDDNAFAVPGNPPPKHKKQSVKRTSRRAGKAPKQRGENARASKTITETPCGSGGKAPGFAITPKVDIRHQMFTPASAFRSAKPGEVLYSVKGSPVVSKTDDIDSADDIPNDAITIITENGNVFRVPADSDDTEEPPKMGNLDDNSVKQIKELQTKLSRMLEHSEKENASSTA